MYVLMEEFPSERLVIERKVKNQVLFRWRDPVVMDIGAIYKHIVGISPLDPKLL